MLSNNRRAQPRAGRSWSFSVTGGAGYIGSHAALRLLKDSYRVTIVDNLSRGNIGAIKVLQEQFPESGRLQFIHADLGDARVVNQIFAKNAFDAVMHFAAVAYVGESTLDPLRSAPLVFLEISCLRLSLTHDNLKTILGPSVTLEDVEGRRCLWPSTKNAAKKKPSYRLAVTSGSGSSREGDARSRRVEVLPLLQHLFFLLPSPSMLLLPLPQLGRSQVDTAW
ncbi:hypothetical protein BHM03_00007683 [Ensete ventricosum]|nr:hypothetical protein BHM03_00007683 [Ensete ventricosum]